jgi:uncharacterized protein (TIGR03437 family)
LVFSVLSGWAAAQAQTLTTIASFNQQEAYPFSTVRATDGSFYGLSQGNVQSLTGFSVFKVNASGALSTLYTFTVLGDQPESLIQASDGNLYGSSQGGNQQCSTGGNPSPCGYVFKVSLSGEPNVIHSFSGTDGFFPTNLIQGSDGSLYGITAVGGTGPCQSLFNGAGCGVFYKITTTGTFTKLYDFDLLNGGATPTSLIQGSDGNFYGTTSFGGAGGCTNNNLPQGCGVVFKLTPQGTMTQLHSFAGTGSSLQTLNFVQGADGDFYGFLAQGGNGRCTQTISGHTFAFGCGEIFEVSSTGVFGRVYDFQPFNGTDATVVGALVAASDGNLYGTTQNEGPNSTTEGNGTIFKLTPAGTFTTVYTFPLGARGGPQAPDSLIQGSDGNFYGTTNNGGTTGYGSIFEFSLTNPIAVTDGVVNGASFLAGIGANAWMTIYGTNLAMTTDTWANAITGHVLPTKLDGVSVMVGGQPAYVEYVSATQINALAPNIAPAPAVPVTVTTSIGTSQAVMAQVQAEQPAFFQWGTYAVATRQDFSLAVKNGTFPGTTTVPAKPGDVIILWGTGFGPTSPAVPVGMETPSDTTYNTANIVSVMIGGMRATVYGAALAPGFAGLYQVAIQVPALANGDYQVLATVANVSSPRLTMITVQE